MLRAASGLAIALGSVAAALAADDIEAPDPGQVFGLATVAVMVSVDSPAALGVLVDAVTSSGPLTLPTLE